MAEATFTLRELADSPSGDNTSFEKHYMLIAQAGYSGDEDDARDFVYANTPATVNGFKNAMGATPTLSRVNDGVRIRATKGLSDKVWDAVVRYSLESWTIPPTGDYSFQGSTGGGSQHVTQALQTMQTVGASGYGTVDYKGRIGVVGVGADQEAQGCDIPAPGFAFVKTKYVAAASVTATYLNILYTLSGLVNSGSMTVSVDPDDPTKTITFAAGELLYEYADFAKRKNSSDWEIAFHCRASPNRSSIAIPGSGTPVLSGITKAGWDYLWVRTEPKSVADSNAKNLVVMQPVQANVERVITQADLSSLNI